MRMSLIGVMFRPERRDKGKTQMLCAFSSPYHQVLRSGGESEQRMSYGIIDRIIRYRPWRSLTACAGVWLVVRWLPPLMDGGTPLFINQLPIVRYDANHEWNRRYRIIPITSLRPQNILLCPYKAGASYVIDTDRQFDSK
jgi:hypothetical protein